MERLKRFRQFVSETWSELKKTTWPGRKEVTGTTLVVIATVMLCAFYLWVVDIFLSKSMHFIFEALK